LKIKDSVGAGRELGVMRNHHEGGSVGTAQGFNQREHLPSGLTIKIARGLISEHATR
jgi:hypothetical protein